MVGIKNYDFYTTEMGRVMMDKLFFLHHVDATYFVDYGCADGQMIEAMSTLVNGEFCGYDNDSKMIEFAKQKSIPNAFFTDDWEKVKFDIAYVSEYSGQKSCLILSSVIHEIYSYGNEDSIKEFWNRVFNSGFDYIVIRDMALSYNNFHTETIADAIVKKADSKQLLDFEAVWGSIYNHKNDIHFLMKYRYIDNWEREVKENYFPISIEYVRGKNLMHENSYQEILFSHFSVPFIRKQIQNDFDIEVSWPTHYKMILERKNET